MDENTRKALTGLLSKGVDAYHAGIRHSIHTLRHAAHTTASLLESAFFPALDSVAKMNGEVARSLMAVVRGERTWHEVMGETSQRLDAGHRFHELVHTWGRDLFGTARFAGETVLAEDAFFRLTYIPPAAGAPAPAQPVAIFHAGGCIPYGDRLFRMAPGYDFYGRFLERGLPVYAMELRGDRDQIDYSGLTIEALVDSIAAMSSHAFAHNRERKLVLEGYCGQGTQALTYVLGRPEDAASKFAALSIFVSPVDGSRCTKIASAVAATPDLHHEALMAFYGALGNYVPGESVQIGLDLPLEALFHKTWLGYFSTGWSRTDLARVKRPEDLTPAQRRDLAGAYWVSTDCSRRFPVPVGIARFTSALFKQGIAADGALPYPVHGRTVSLAALRDQTRMPVLGIYGGRDPVVPDATAHVLMGVLGPRYTHVVHAQAGHVSYVLSPKLWDPASATGLRPNPVDVICERVAAAGRQ
jgi:pimeloyl-ACP methyl ester carboxylesterase